MAEAEDIGFDGGDGLDRRQEPPARARRQPAAGPQGPAGPGGAAEGRRPPTRVHRELPPKPSAIIPPGGVAGRPLFLVVTVMCYLACVTLGASLLVSGQISNWTSDIAGEITVQVRPTDAANIDSQVAAAVQLLVSTPGVVGADPITAEEAAELLEPWLGGGNVLDDLPIPRLISVEIDVDNPPDLDALAGRLDSEVEGASLDDHRRWQSSLRRMAASLQIIAWAVIILVGATTLAIIVFATHAAMSGNREIIEVLHLVGATESYIAYQIQKRFFALGLISGLIGTGFAILTFLALNSLSGAVAAGSFTGAPSSLMFGPLSLDFSSYMLFFLIPVAASVIGVITSRVIVVGVLRVMH
jgi:cell division transport system permease protein